MPMVSRYIGNKINDFAQSLAKIPITHHSIQNEKRNIIALNK
jgi:hypothetical protein